MKKRYRLLIICGFIFMLIMVRSYGVGTFYDPFIKYFEGDFLTANFPEFNMSKLFVHMGLRYTLNTIISIAIIYFSFMNKEVVLFVIKFYILSFVVFSLAYFILLKIEFSNGYLLAFYVRRMIIHPLFLVILLPALYFDKKRNS
jgi:exosortase F-associated protein